MQVKENVWLHSKYQPWEKGLINYFVETGRWDKIIWTSPENSDKTYVDYSNMTTIPGYTYNAIPIDLYNKIYPYLYQFSDMYSRTSADGSQNMYDGKNIHDYADLFNMLVNFYYNALVKNKIDLIILFAAPHVGRDLILYLLAKEMGLKTLILEQSLFSNRFFHYFDHSDFGTFATSKVIADVNPVAIEKSFKKNLPYMKDILKSMKEKPSLAKRLRDFRSGPEVRLLHDLRNKYKRAFSSLHYYNSKVFSKNQVEIQDDSFDLDKPFVYFPLHLQPEKTTSSWGGKYNDQALAIEHLSQYLPEGWWIYVKENPKQATYFMRGPWFYKRLKGLKNVKVVPSQTDTYSLLDKCKFVATITGTVGWEAITGGKKVVVFGWGTWYRTLPGCFMFDENFDINAVLDYVVDHNTIEEKIALIQAKMGTGIIYKGAYKALVDGFSEEENFKHVTDSFEKILGYK